MEELKLNISKKIEETTNPETKEYRNKLAEDLKKIKEIDPELAFEHLTRQQVGGEYVDSLEDIQESREEAIRDKNELSEQFNEERGTEDTKTEAHPSKQQENIEHLNRIKEQEEESLKRIKRNIENGQKQLEKYADVLDQKVEYTREQYLSGEAKIVSEDAEKYSQMWNQFPANPLVMASGRDPMVEKLIEKKYSPERIEELKQQREEFLQLRDHIQDSLQKETARWSEIGFSNHNDISAQSFPFINVGNGNHYLDEKLLGKQMTLGELLEKDIEFKQGDLEKQEVKIMEIEKEMSELKEQVG